MKMIHPKIPDLIDTWMRNSPTIRAPLREQNPNRVLNPLRKFHPGLQWVTDPCNKFLTEGKGSDFTADIVPGFKKGDPADPENYRYFALSCTLEKIVRRVIAERIYQVISAELPESFFGFVKGKGTQDAFHSPV